MEESKTTISLILSLFVLLAGFNLTFAETQLPVKENVVLEASSFRPDLAATFDDDNSVVPPALEAPEPVYCSNTDSSSLPRSVPSQRYRLSTIRAPPYSSFLPA